MTQLLNLFSQVFANQSKNNGYQQFINTNQASTNKEVDSSDYLAHYLAYRGL